MTEGLQEIMAKRFMYAGAAVEIMIYCIKLKVFYLTVLFVYIY